MVLKLYHDPISQPCRAVYLFLKITGVEFESKELDVFKGDLKEPDMLKKNHLNQIPFIEDDGFVLSESVAIMRYIAIKYELADHWFPRADIQQQAKFEEFMNWQQMNIRKPCLDVFLNTVRSRLTIGFLTKQPQDKATSIVNKAKADLKITIKHLDEYFLQDKPFITGDDISAADLLVELYQLMGCEEEDLYQNNKKVAAWMQRVEDRLAPHSAQACMRINKVREQFKQAN